MVKTINLTTKLSAIALAIALAGCGADLEPSDNDLSSAPKFTPPVITSTPPTDGVADSEYTYTLMATDAENDVLTFSAVLPADSWLMFDAATGTLSGTPEADDAGNISVKLIVNDGTFDVAQSFTIAVAGAQAPETTGNILKNSAFSTGMSSWTSNLGTSVYERLIPDATPNVYDVNLSQILTLVANEPYTFKFDAKASVDRGIVVGIGFNHDPWDNVTETPALTTEWQTYTYNLTPTVGDNNSRTIFDMGGVAGDVYLRSIELVNSTGTDLIPGTVPIGSFFEVNVAEVGEPSSANLMQTVSIEQGKSYVVSFRAKASTERSMEVGLGNGDTNSLETIALTTEWLPLFAVIDATNFGGEDSQVIFNMGAELGDVYLDDVKVGMVLAAGAPLINSTAETSAIVGEEYSYTLTAVDPESDPLTLSATLPEASWLSFDAETGILSGIPTSEDLDTSVEVGLSVSDGSSTISQAFTIAVRGLLVNNGFDMGLTDWVMSGNGSIVYEVPVPTATPGEAWRVNYSQQLALVADAAYTFSFDAKAAVARNILASIGLNQDPWTSTVAESVALTTEWQSFTYDLTSPVTSENSRTIFDMGAEMGDVSLRNIKLIDETETDLIPTATNILNSGNNYYQVLIPTAGEGWQANLSQITVIEPGKDYVIKFKAKASVARNIVVGVGLNADPWSAGQKDVPLSTEWEDYVVEVRSTTADSIDFGDVAARVLFDMGAEAGDVSIDDITIEKVLE